MPPEAWWDDFYTPMERIIEEFLGKYADDPEALEILKQLALEPAAHRKNSDYYNYEFFITRKVQSLPVNNDLMVWATPHSLGANP